MAGGAQVQGRFAQPVDCLFQGQGHGFQCGNGLGRCHGLVYLFQERHEILAFFHTQFAAQEIHGLDTVGAFIDAGDLAVSQVLLHGILHGVAVAAKSLHRLGAKPRRPCPCSRP